MWDLINKKTWEPIWTRGKGAWVHLTDPEGSDMRFRLKEEHWEASHYEGHRRRFEPNYYLGHLFGYPTPPYNPGIEAEGVLAGTINHYSRPFPHAKAFFEGGKVARVEGGGEYGDKWREIMDLTKDIKYPEYPDKGLFWMWEVAIGTHPKMARPPYAFTLSGHAAMYERLRSGYIHVGIGTANANVSETWAEERGLPWGHLHIHMQFPTYTLETADGEEITVIKDGHLTALDDPEVIALASQYGDPAELLAEAWTPPSRASRSRATTGRTTRRIRRRGSSDTTRSAPDRPALAGRPGPCSQRGSAGFRRVAERRPPQRSATRSSSWPGDVRAAAPVVGAPGR